MAPASRSASAWVSPRPRAPPETMMTFPWRLNSGVFLPDVMIVDADPAGVAGVASDILSGCIDSCAQLCFISITEVEDCLRVGFCSGEDEEGEEGEDGAFRRFVLLCIYSTCSHDITTHLRRPLPRYAGMHRSTKP